MFGGDSISTFSLLTGLVGLRAGLGLCRGFEETEGMRVSRDGVRVSFDLALPVRPAKLCLFRTSILSGEVRPFFSLVFSRLSSFDIGLSSAVPLFKRSNSPGILDMS